MFSARSKRKELLDQDRIPVEDLYVNLRELDFINRWLGGYNISFAALKKILKPAKRYVLADIGCGGGDTLKGIIKWNQSRNYDLRLYGIDLKPACIQYARNQLAGHTVQFICDDYRNIFSHLNKVDIIHACLFCHHLREEELIGLVKFALANQSVLVINDLERNALAYYSIKILTRIFSKSYLVKNDAPLSVLRGFKRKEWLSILKKAGAQKFSVRNKWAFRHEVIVYA
jgi:SAM-dependent methyltransferase